MKTLERRKAIYLSILVVGSVFALLTYIVDQETEATLTILYITLFLILILRLYEEWHYYRSHNAPPASAIFIALLTPLALGGSYVAGIATLGPLLSDIDLRFPLIEILLSLDFIGIGDFSLFLSLFGLIFALPAFTLLIFLLRKYFSGRYPVIFIFRKRYPRETLIVYSLAMFFLLGIIWLQTRLVELSSLIFVVVVSFLLLQHYVYRFIIVPVRRGEPRTRQAAARSARANRSGSTRSVSSNRSRSSTGLSTAPTSSSRSRSLSRAPTSSSRSRSLSTAARSSSRNRDDLPINTGTASRDRRGSYSSRNAARNDIEVAPALNQQEFATSPRRIKASPEVLEKLTPIGQNLTEDNFKCIFCYQFPIESHRKVVICPHCKHPGHADEWQNWLSVSSICSRCNKPVDQSKLVRVSGKNYNKLLKMFRDNKLKVKRS
ncbi:MAG: hypothetical protein ACFFD4_15880 [Candidatus Odinarchaeota archaeon]